MGFIYADHPARFGEATEALIDSTVRELMPAKFLAAGGKGVNRTASR